MNPLSHIISSQNFVFLIKGFKRDFVWCQVEMQMCLLEPQLFFDQESENPAIKEVSQTWFHKDPYASPQFPLYNHLIIKLYKQMENPSMYEASITYPFNENMIDKKKETEVNVYVLKWNNGQWEEVRFSTVDKAHLHWGKQFLKAEKGYTIRLHIQKFWIPNELLTLVLLGKETWMNGLRETFRFYYLKRSVFKIVDCVSANFTKYVLKTLIDFNFH